MPQTRNLDGIVIRKTLPWCKVTKWSSSTAHANSHFSEYNIIHYCVVISTFGVIIFNIIFFLFQIWRKHNEGVPWPQNRCYHIAACLGYGGQHQRILISGGAYGGVEMYDDMWLMDPQSGKMEEVRIALEDFVLFLL